MTEGDIFFARRGKIRVIINSIKRYYNSNNE